MNKQMTKKLYEQLVQKALVGSDQDEYIIATVYHPATQLVCEGANSDEIRRYITKVSANIGNRIAIQLADMSFPDIKQNYVAVDLISYTSDTPEKPTFIKEAIESIDNAEDIAFDILPQFAAGNLLDMMEKDESDVTQPLHAYYAVVVTLPKNKVGIRKVVSVNLHQYVQELLTVTSDNKTRKG